MATVLTAPTQNEASKPIDQRMLVARLRAILATLHDCEKVELLETHISFVLLAGAYAYKIKKSVKLTFLDFTTLSARRFYCEEELRLNRRYAPQLYLAVVPITGSAPSQGGVDESARSDLFTEYERHLSLAQCHLEPQRPAIVITHGMSGCGRTTFSQGMLEAMGAVRIRSDIERKRLVGMQANSRSIAQRRNKRKDASEADLAVLEYQLAAAEALMSDELPDEIRYDTTGMLANAASPETWRPLMNRLGVLSRP